MNKYYYSLIVMLLVPLAGLSTDVYIPSLPAIAAHFSVDKALTQYTVTSYVFAMGIAQLIAGPISDAYGRKKPIIIALLLQIFSIVMVLNATSISAFIIFRFFQGLGAALMVVPARAILNDRFTGVALKKQFNYLTICFAMGPIVAPFIGGYLQHYIGWQANFYLLLIYASVMLLLVGFTIKETLSTPHPFSVSLLWKNYGIVLSNKHFVIGALMLGILFGYLGLFNVTGTFIIQTALHQSAITYGHIALLMGLAWFLGNFLNRFIFHVDRTLKTKVALLISVLGSLVMLGLSMVGYFNLPSISIPTFFMIMVSAVVFATYVSECLTLFPKLAASANGALFSILWVIFSLYTYIASLLKIHSLLPLAITYFSIGMIALLLYLGFLLPMEKSQAKPGSV